MSDKGKIFIYQGASTGWFTKGKEYECQNENYLHQGSFINDYGGLDGQYPNNDAYFKLKGTVKRMFS